MYADGMTRWLDEDEDRTWRSLWSVMTWLPMRLDAQLRADAGLSLSEYHALSQISEAADRTIRLSDLAVNTNMTLSHLSRVITRMEKAGWVERSPDPTDGRYTLGHLTEAGWEKVKASAPGHVEAVRSYVFDSLREDQVTALGEAAAIIASAVDDRS